MTLAFPWKRYSNVPLLFDDEIKTLRTFVLLEKWKCFNDHEKWDGTKGVRERICSCLNRWHSFIISCVHAESEYLWREWAINVLKRTKPIFAKTNTNIYNLCHLFHEMLLIFDFIRQALEWSRQNLIVKIWSFELLAQEFSEDNLVKDLYKLADEIADFNWAMSGNDYARFLVRFRSLKNIFSSLWEPRVLNELQTHAQILIDNQPD